jgi:tetratricopeptide (TPR) repeat protein
LGSIILAENYYQQSLSIRREVQDRRGEGVVLYYLALIAEEREEWKQAEAWHQQSLQIARDMGSGPDIAPSLRALGRLLIEHRDKPAEGCGLLQEAAQIYEQMGLEEETGETRELARKLGCEVSGGR